MESVLSEFMPNADLDSLFAQFDPDGLDTNAFL